MLSFYLQMVETPEEKSLVEQLYYQYENIIFNVASSILKNKHDAEDAVQETFVRIIKNIQKISRITADERQYYIVIIARNSAIDILRKNVRSVHSDIDEMYDMQAEDNVEEKVLSDLSCEGIKAALRELSANDYEILYLYLVLDFTASEVALALGIDSHTASQRIYSAKNKLKRKLGEVSELR